MEHYESLTIGISIVVGVVVLGLIWLAVKIAEKIVRAREKRQGGDVNLREPFGKPFLAIMPPGSNGFAYVLDDDGCEWCTCYAGGLDKAQMIAAALNAYSPKGD
jgi:hypothetical protein